MSQRRVTSWLHIMLALKAFALIGSSRGIYHVMCNYRVAESRVYLMFKYDLDAMDRCKF
jgi:hypothetical protein